MQTILEALEMGNQGDATDGDVSDLEVGVAEEEDPAKVTPKMRFFKSLLGPHLNPDLRVQFIQEVLTMRSC